MASRFETVPEDFLDHLRTTIPGFMDEKFEHQFGLARMAWIGLNKGNQHSHFKGAMTFHYKDLEAVFGRSQFLKINERCHLFFRTAAWSQAFAYTKGYEFSVLLRESIESYLAAAPWKTTTRLVTADGKGVGCVLPAIASKDKAEVTTRAWINATNLSPVTVNLDALGRLKSELQTACSEWRASEGAIGAADLPELADFERVVEIVGKVCRLAMIDATGAGKMAHRYEEAQSGRLYPLGISLASAQTVVKDAALEGNWEYDIANCHYAIFEQMAAKGGHECVAIRNYLENKRETRQAIADHAGIKVRQAKTCLVALMYGARASAWHENAIAREIGKVAARKLFEFPLFTGLSTEITAARKVVLAECPRTPKGWLNNAFCKSIDSKATPEQQMAHLLQGVEAKALQAVINLFPSKIVLVQHDGFVSTNQLDTSVLSEAIFAATSYRLELEETRLAANAMDYFSSRM